MAGLGGGVHELEVSLRWGFCGSREGEHSLLNPHHTVFRHDKATSMDKVT